ncbi:MAG: metal-dependent transcriptional regulator [Ignavibacteria bacterium]|nr:metal-dependent transcriptional regulator [Ignavibacteria bacterium]
MSTTSKENYLKAIYNYQSLESDTATTSNLANYLNVSNAAISDMAKKLSDIGLITYEKYKGMELTSKGEKIALNVIRRHRLWELFLMKVLELKWSEVHDEAEQLEHHTSEALIDQIDKFLNFPDFDPHGHPIPKKNGLLPKYPKTLLLSNAELNRNYVFVRVNDRESELISFLTNLGLILNTNLTVKEKFSFDESIVVRINDRNISLSKKVSENMYVQLI